MVLAQSTVKVLIFPVPIFGFLLKATFLEPFHDLRFSQPVVDGLLTPSPLGLGLGSGPRLALRVVVSNSVVVPGLVPGSGMLAPVIECVATP